MQPAANQLPGREEGDEAGRPIGVRLEGCEALADS